jgi:tRNA pseudouridine65 synthase
MPAMELHTFAATLKKNLVCSEFESMNLEIVYEDEQLVAINKPHGLLVHRTKIAKDASEFALQLLRNQIGQHVYPCHRLDRKTSGVLLFAKDEETNKRMQIKFAEGQVSKKYLAIVRGYTNQKGIIDYPLKKDDGIIQEAVTAYRTLQQTELNVPFAGKSTSRYSLLEIEPLTGRMHQIRKHFAHIFHPIIGDRPHGCNKQNRLFKEKWEMTTMMLHANVLAFQHPVTSQPITISSQPFEEFKRVTRILEFESDAMNNNQHPNS